jgi:foldase protein PrsA
MIVPRRRRRHVSLLRSWALALPVCLGLWTCVGLGGCGGTSGGVVAQVDRTAITGPMLDHWVSIVGADKAAPSPAGQGTPRQRALDYLISSQWLIGESASRGLAISEQEVNRRVAGRRAASFPGGETEFRAFLATTHRSMADVEFEAKVELASSGLRQLAAAAAPRVTDAQVKRYYEQNRRQFVIPEERVTKYASTKKRAQAERLKHEVESGRRDLTSAEQRTYGESTYTVNNPSSHRSPLEVAVFAAKPNVLTNVVILGGDYYLFKVIKVFPPVTQSFAQVKRTIKKQLAEEAQRQALAAFVKTWREKWAARTDCRPGYIVQKCNQYSGPTAPENTSNFN